MGLVPCDGRSGYSVACIVGFVSVYEELPCWKFCECAIDLMFGGVRLGYKIFLVFCVRGLNRIGMVLLRCMMYSVVCGVYTLVVTLI